MRSPRDGRAPSAVKVAAVAGRSQAER
jgi:hypothetical protein